MATIYRKTTKGQQEIETRAHRLGPRLRGALILVDGHRNDEDLRRMLPQQPDETLAALVAQGFIEIIAVTPQFARPAAAAAPTPPTTVSPPLSMPPRSFETLRADLVRNFTDLVGPMGEALAIRMERSRNPGELMPLLDVAQRIVANARGAQAAANFNAHVQRSLS